MPGGTTVTLADILAQRPDGLSLDEIWSLLCRALHTLQDLFHSGDITDEAIVPLVKPQTLGITSKGSVVIKVVYQTRPGDPYFLAPEYQARTKRNLTNLDLEKMWVYSLGRSLLASMKSHPTTGETLAVLNLMTDDEPKGRASLVFLTSIICNHRRSLPLKPSDLVLEMYREVFGSPPQCLLPPPIPERNESLVKKTSTEYMPPRTFVEEKCAESSLSEMPKKTASPPISSCEGPSDYCKAQVVLKRNPVKRVPSRLYRGPSGTEVKAGEKYCVDPEFVVRADEESVVHLGDTKESQKRSLTVILPTGQKIQVACDPHTITCGKLFETLVEIELLEDNYIFVLACTINGDLMFIPSETKLHKVAPSRRKDNKNCSPFLLFLRVKFFLPSLRGVKSSKTRHLMYLQLRRSLLEQQIKCDLQELFSLGGLALQADFGNFEEEKHGTCSYFLLEHYLPDELLDDRVELEERLQQSHRSRFGVDPSRAEEIFVARGTGKSGLFRSTMPLSGKTYRASAAVKNTSALSPNALGRKSLLQITPGEKKEFGISLHRERKVDFYVERTEERGQRQGTRPTTTQGRLPTPFCHRKENENPVEGAMNRGENRAGVKMRVRAFHPPPLHSSPEVSTIFYDVSVIDSSIRSSDEKLVHSHRPVR